MRSGVRCWITIIGWGVAFGACEYACGLSLWGCCDVFFMDCESGSGAFWTRKDVSVGLGWAA